MDYGGCAYHVRLRNVARIRKMAKSATASDDAAALCKMCISYCMVMNMTGDAELSLPVAVENACPPGTVMSPLAHLRELKSTINLQRHTMFGQYIHICPYIFISIFF
jgi:hypothetical protein